MSLETTLFFSVSSIPIIGTVLNIYASSQFKGEGRLSMLKLLSLLKASIDIVFIISWATFFYWNPILSIPFFFLAGLLLLALSYGLFVLIHDQIYVKRGTTLTSIAIPGILLAQSVIEQYKDIITNVYSIGLGFILAINLLSVYYAFQLYREMTGGAAIWLYLAIYTVTIFITSLLNVLATFYNITRVITDQDSFILSTSSTIIPDIVIVAISSYYKRVILPLIKEIS